jgi:uncharacterized protein YutE (UPF0331/DUF86 family)
MINKTFINERLVMINSLLKKLYKLSDLDEETFLSEDIYHAACESYLRRALEAIFDIGRHILAKSGYTDLSYEYNSIAKGLFELGILDKDLEEKLIQMAGYRNRLVHMYHLVSNQELYKIIKSDLKDIEKFITSIKEYMDKF